MSNNTVHNCPSCGKPYAFVEVMNKRVIVECTNAQCMLFDHPATAENLATAYQAIRKGKRHA